MAVSKVIYGNETLIDLTNDTVSSSNLLAGATAHGANGEPITGSVTTHEYTAGAGIDIDEDDVISTDTRIIDITQAEYDALTQEEKMDASVFYNITDRNVTSAEVVDNLSTNDGTKALSAKQGKVLNDKFEENVGHQIAGVITDSTTVTFTNATYIGSADYLLKFYCSNPSVFIEEITSSSNTVTVTYSDDITGTTNICVATKVVI